MSPADEAAIQRVIETRLTDEQQADLKEVQRKRQRPARLEQISKAKDLIGDLEAANAPKQVIEDVKNKIKEAKRKMETPLQAAKRETREQRVKAEAAEKRVKALSKTATKAKEIQSLQTEAKKAVMEAFPANKEAQAKLLKKLPGINKQGKLENFMRQLEKEKKFQERKKLVEDLRTPIPKDVDIKFRKKIDDLFEGLDLVKPTDKTLKELRSRFTKFAQEESAETIPKQYIQELVRLFQKPAAELSTQDLQALKTAKEILETSGKTLRRLKIERDERELKKILSVVRDGTVNTQKTFSQKRIDRMTPQQLRKAQRNAVREKIMPLMAKPMITDTFDGGASFTGPNTKILWEQFLEKTQGEYYDAVRHEVDSFYQDLLQSFSDKEVNNLMQARSREKITAALAFDQRAFTQMEESGWGRKRPNLTPKQEKFIEIYRKWMNEDFNEIAAYDAVVNNTVPPKEENYSRLAYTRDSLQDNYSDMEIAEMGMENFADALRFNAKASLNSQEGILKPRKVGVRRELRTDLINVLFETFAMRKFLIHRAIPLRNLQAITTHPSYAEKAGDNAAEWWTRQIRGASRSMLEAFPNLNPQALFSPHHNLVTAWVGGSIGTVIVQPSQIATSAAIANSMYGPTTATEIATSQIINFIKPSILLRALKISDQLSVTERAKMESEAVRNRGVGDVIVEQHLRHMGATRGRVRKEVQKQTRALEEAIRDAMDTRGMIMRQLVKYRNRLSTAGFAPLQMADVRTAATSYFEFKKIFMRHGATEEDAATHANLFVRIANADASHAYRPELWDTMQIRGHSPVVKTSKFVMKQLLLLQTFSVNSMNVLTYNFMFRKMLKGARGKNKAAAPGEKTGLYGAFLGAFSIAMVAYGLYAFDELRRKVTNAIRTDLPQMLGFKGARRIEGDGWIFGPLISIAALFPVIGDSVFSAVKGYGGVNSPLTGTIEDMTRYAFRLATSEKRRPQNALRLARAAVYLLGVAFVKDPSNFLLGILEGKETKLEKQRREYKEKKKERNKKSILDFFTPKKKTREGSLGI